MRNNVAQFKKSLVVLVKRNKYDCVIPMTDGDHAILLEMLPALEKITQVLITTSKELHSLTDKKAVLAFCKNIGISVPQTSLVSTAKDVEALAKKTAYPCVLKPRHSMALKHNRIVSHRVSICNSEQQLVKAYACLQKKMEDALVQEYIYGSGFGFYALAEQGVCKAFVIQKRVHEVPFYGGASSLRATVSNKTLEKISKKIISQMGVDGVIMIEYRRNEKDNTYSLMEINPRFWGSLELTIKSGIDMPRLLVESPKKIESIYKKNVFCRYLFTGELSYVWSIVTYKKRLHYAKPPQKMKTLAEFFTLFFKKDMHYDFFSMQDPLPAIMQIVFLPYHLLRFLRR